MIDLLELQEPLLINTIGHATGVLLFGLFIALFLKDQRGAQRRRNWLPVAIAVLALFWNLGSLAVLAASHYALRSADLLVAISFSFLSLLPALLLHFSLEGRLAAVRKIGYGISALAVVFHFVELRMESVTWHQAAIILITVGFTLLTVISVLMLRREGETERSQTSHIWGAMCLFLFAISFVHFGTGHASHAWSAEIAVHHAGIPLALVVLLQDYRFLLYDAFLRFLTNASVAAAFLALLVIANSRLSLIERAAGDSFLEGVLAVIVCLLLIAFSLSRAHLQRFVTHKVFRRRDIAAAVKALRTLGTTASDEQTYLDEAADQIRDSVSAQTVRIAIHPIEALDNPEASAPYPVTDRTDLRSENDLQWVRPWCLCASLAERVAGFY